MDQTASLETKSVNMNKYALKCLLWFFIAAVAFALIKAFFKISPTTVTPILVMIGGLMANDAFLKGHNRNYTPVERRSLTSLSFLYITLFNLTIIALVWYLPVGPNGETLQSVAKDYMGLWVGILIFFTLLIYFILKLMYGFMMRKMLKDRIKQGEKNANKKRA